MTVLIVFYPLLFVWQGLDFTDMGHWLTAYQTFHSAPDSISRLLLNWASIATGAGVYWMAGDLGVVAFRLAYVVVIWSTLLATHILVRHAVRPQQSGYLAILLLTEVYVTKSFGNWIDYNNLTALFFVLTALGMYRGLTRSSLAWMAFAGVATGANIFFRFPNILGVALVAIIPIWCHYAQRPNRELIRASLAYIGGVSLSIMIVLGLILEAGHGMHFFAALKRVISVASSDDSIYSTGRLTGLLVTDLTRALPRGAVVVMGSLIFSLLCAYLKPPWRNSAILVLAVLCFPILGMDDSWRWTVTGTLYLLLGCAAVWFRSRKPEIALLSSIALAILLLAPLGSSNGMFNAVFGSWLAIPALFVVQGQAISMSWPAADHGSAHGPHRMKILKAMSLFLAGTLMLFSCHEKYFNTYRDLPDRRLLNSPIDAAQLPYIFTSPERARVVSELLLQLEDHIAPGTHILAYGNIPAVHYLTRTYPILDTPWPSLLRDGELLRSLDEISCTPPRFIVRSLGDTKSRFWPYLPSWHSMSEGDRKKRRIFDGFIQDIGYDGVWRNDFFELLRLRGENSGCAR